MDASRKGMQTADAITSLEDIATIKRFLGKHYPQIAHVFRLGINVALRVTDLLNIRFTDIDSNNILRAKEGKTGKIRTIKLNSAAREVIAEIKEAYPIDIYLFQSHSPRMKALQKPLTRQSVHTAFKEVREARDLDFVFSSHSMRKCWGYMQYTNKAQSIGQIMTALNHSSEAITLRYIGITQQTMNDMYEEMPL